MVEQLLWCVGAVHAQLIVIAWVLHAYVHTLANKYLLSIFIA